MLQRYRATVRLLLVVVALAMVPVIILASPKVAGAAVNTWHEAQISMDHWVPGASAECSAQVGYDVSSGIGGQRVSIRNGVCYMGRDTAPGMSVRMDFIGINEQEAACDASAYMTTQTTDETSHTFEGTAGSGIGLFDGCQVTEVCWTLSPVDDWGWDIGWEDECSLLSMGVPGASTEGQCPEFDVDGLNAKIQRSAGYATRFDVIVTAGIGWKGTHTQIMVALIYRRNGGALTSGWPGGSNGFAQSIYRPGNEAARYQIRESSYGAMTEYQIVGVQLRSNPDLPPDQFSHALPQDVAGGDLGLTVPANCRFYFGAKIAETPDSLDEPAGPIDGGVGSGGEPPPPADPPAPPSSGCTFSISDPASWLEGGMCAVVGLLRDIFTALGELARGIAGLAGAIIGGILDGIEALFVPDPSSWGWAGLVNQMQNRAPASVLIQIGDGIGGVADGYSSSGSCGSLANFSSDDIAANVTCASASGPVFSILRALVSAGLFALTGLALFKRFSGLLQDGQ